MKNNLKYYLLSYFILLIYLFFPLSNRANEKKWSIATNQLHSVSNLKNGDIIFQISTSGQGKAIQLATKSLYSHCGIIFKEGNEFFVYEAVQPVKKTPLSKFIAQGDNGHYIIKRLKNSDQILTDEVLKKMKAMAVSFLGKNYDLTFEWSDEKIYCSELVWKVYKHGTGLEVGKLQKLSYYDLSHDIVKKKLEERYGKNIPYDEMMISPGAIFDSELLVTVMEKK
ncbi:MAG: YiiX family permuted papain-like enzyme [Cytophagaceae bacterium]